MYGTICHFFVKPGMKHMIDEIEREYDSIEILGWRAEYVYQMDRNSNEYYMVVLFDSEEAYKRNAASPDQDERYRHFAAMLDGEPEWNDGTITHARMSERVR